MTDTLRNWKLFCTDSDGVEHCVGRDASGSELAAIERAKYRAIHGSENSEKIKGAKDFPNKKFRVVDVTHSGEIDVPLPLAMRLAASKAEGEIPRALGAFPSGHYDQALKGEQEQPKAEGSPKHRQLKAPKFK